MGDGAVSIAPGANANVNIGTAFDIFVRVRDMTGRPLKGAVVTFGGTTIAPRTTDADGLVVVKDAVVRSIQLNATYTAQFGSKPGSITSAKPRNVSITGAFDPSPQGAPDPKARRELHATLSVPIYFPLKHLFSWQSAVLRKKVYLDGISVGEFIQAHPKDRPDFNRVLRLSTSLDLVDNSRAEISSAEKKLAEIQKSIAAQKKALAQDDKKLETDKGRLEAHDKKVAAADDSKLSDAAKAKKEDRNAKERAGLQGKVDQDAQAREKRLAELDQTEKNLEIANAALAAAKSRHGGSTHRELLEYLVDKVFPASSLEGWIKYGIIHLTGLRYRPSSGCCFPPGPMVYGLREKEIDEREHPSSSALGDDAFGSAQRTYAREYLALLKENSELAKSAAAVYPNQRSMVAVNQKPRPYAAHGRFYKATPKVSGEQLVEMLEKLARSEGPWMAKAEDKATKSKAVVPNDLFELRAIASAVCQAWLKSVEAARAGGIPKGPADENELLGEIADRFFQQEIPEIVWRRAVMCTQLLHDFVDPSWDMTPRDWNKPKVPPEWSRVFHADDSAWLKRHSETMQPYFTGVVCNDVASILARARGLPIGDEEYIMGIARTIRDAGKTAAERSAADAAKAAKADELAKVAVAAGQGAMAGAGDAPADPTKPPPPAAPAPAPPFVGLYRPKAVSDIQVGDIIFYGHWVAAGDEAREVHIIPPNTIIDLGPMQGKVDASQFGAALTNGIGPVDELDELEPAAGVNVYGVQRNRPSTFRKQDDGTMKEVKHADRVVRGWINNHDPADPKTVYDQLTYMHISTVIGFKDGQVLCLETDAPVGVTKRSWDFVSTAEVFFGRLTPKNPPDLSWFLDRENLLSKGRLDDG